MVPTDGTYAPRLVSVVHEDLTTVNLLRLCVHVVVKVGWVVEVFHVSFALFLLFFVLNCLETLFTLGNRRHAFCVILDGLVGEVTHGCLVNFLCFYPFHFKVCSQTLRLPVSLSFSSNTLTVGLRHLHLFESHFLSLVLHL